MTASELGSATIHRPHCQRKCIGLGPFAEGGHRFDLSIHKANYRDGEPSKEDYIVLVYGESRDRSMDVRVCGITTQRTYDAQMESTKEAIRRANIKGLLHPEFLARGLVL